MSNDLIKYKYTDGKEYPAILVCADAVVFSWDYVDNLMVCMIKRKDNGRWALPGGFVNYNETLYGASIRELLEETGLDLCRTHDKHYRGSQLFDAPNRTKKGNRKITTAYVFTIVSPQLMELYGADDAQQAKWIKWKDVKKLKTFQIHDDHKEIIEKSIQFI